MTTINRSHVNLVLTPAIILESVVHAKTPLSVLVDQSAIVNIISPSDLLFYKWVQTQQDKLLPSYTTAYFNRGLVEGNYEETEECKLSEIRFKELGKDLDRFKSNLAQTLREPPTTSVPAVNNSYVGHYYSIDKSTIGVVLMTSPVSPKTDEVKALKGLMSLLASNYLGSVDGVANTSNDTHIVNLVKSGLLTAFDQLIKQE